MARCGPTKTADLTLLRHRAAAQLLLLVREAVLDQPHHRVEALELDALTLHHRLRSPTLTARHRAVKEREHVVERRMRCGGV